jgi:hypothetical protein
VSFILEFVAFARARKKLWLIPIVLVFAAIGSLLVLAKGSALSISIDQH